MTDDEQDRTRSEERDGTRNEGDGRALVLFLSGPNLNLLGEREPEVYGFRALEELVDAAGSRAAELGLALDHLQSNHEGELVDAIQRARSAASGIIINAGAFSHYSWAIHDALACFGGPVIELHISNPMAREEFRRTSVVSSVADGIISGFGAAGYPLAVTAIAGLLGSHR